MTPVGNWKWCRTHFFSVIILSLVSFSPASPCIVSQGKSQSNSRVTTTIANVILGSHQPLFLHSVSQLQLCLCSEARMSEDAVSVTCFWVGLSVASDVRGKMMLLLLLGNAEVQISLQALKNWVMPGHLLVTCLLQSRKEPVQRWSRAHPLCLPFLWFKGHS